MAASPNGDDQAVTIDGTLSSHARFYRWPEMGLGGESMDFEEKPGTGAETSTAQRKVKDGDPAPGPGPSCR